MLQSIGNSVIFDIGCLVSAVRQDQGIRVAHCDAVSGELQHKKIVRAVAECIGVSSQALSSCMKHRKCSSANLRKVSISESADGKARNLSNVKWLYVSGG